MEELRSKRETNKKARLSSVCYASHSSHNRYLVVIGYLPVRAAQSASASGLLTLFASVSRTSSDLSFTTKDT